MSRRHPVHAFVRDHPGCMLRSVVGATAANMMLVRCRSDVPISLACSMGSATVLTTTSSEPRPCGTPGPAIRQATVERPGGQVAWGTWISVRKGVPTTHIRCRITLIPRARQPWPALRLGGGRPCAAHVLDPATVHHDSCRLAQCTAQVDVTGLGDPARDVSLATDYAKE
jgi:hypothetical protein